MGGSRPPSFTISTITYKVVVYAPAERADTLHLFLLYPYMYSVNSATFLEPTSYEPFPSILSHKFPSAISQARLNDVPRQSSIYVSSLLEQHKSTENHSGHLEKICKECTICSGCFLQSSKRLYHENINTTLQC